MSRHDLGLYEAIWSLALVACVLVLTRQRRPRGTFVVVVALSYALSRFALELLQLPHDEGGPDRYLGLTAEQYCAIVLGLAAVVLVRFIRTTRDEPASQPEAPAPSPAKKKKKKSVRAAPAKSD